MIDKSYSPDFAAGSTYTPETPIPIDPSTIGVTNASPDFVVPVGGGGTPITDYVPASTGGTFSGLVSYNNAKTLTGDYNFTYKSWVESTIATAITDGNFTTLFNSLFAAKSITDLGTKTHNSTTSIQGGTSGEYYHLTSAQYTNATRVATSSVTGLLSNTDWNTFNNKLDAILEGTGISIVGTTISTNDSEINHDSLLNFVSLEHVPLDDTKTTTSYVWSASKIISYVASQIPAEITDFVSKADGGNFENLIGYGSDLTITGNTTIPHKKYVDDSIASGISTYDTAIFGGSTGSILEYLGTLDITDIGTREHNNLTTFQGGISGQYYHLSQTEHTEATQYATGSLNGLLSSVDWAYFDAKLDAFDTLESAVYAEFLYYDAGYLYYNPAYLDHNSLLNYVVDEHTPLDDTSTTTSNLWSASKIYAMIGSNAVYPYFIRLENAGTVGGRLVGLTEGVDYPVGWILTDDGADLLVEHNLDEKSILVSIQSLNSGTSNLIQLQGNVAYSSITNEYYSSGYNRIRVSALATVATELYIYILI